MDTSEDTSDGTLTITSISSNGDLLLRTGTIGRANLLVSSTVMIEASEVFRALLGPRFREGQQVGTPSHPKEIKLPEDDGQAMTDMCNLLHNKPVPHFTKRRGASSVEIFALAMVIDKYALIEHLRLQCQAILFAYCDGYDNPQRRASSRMIAASYMLDQPRNFTIATERMIMKAFGGYAKTSKGNAADVLPASVLRAMEQKRDAACQKVIHDLAELGMPVCIASVCEGYGLNSVNYDVGYLDRLCTAFRVPYWPPDMRARSIASAIKDIRGIGAIKLKSRTCIHTGGRSGVSPAAFMKVADDLENICRGLCLFCVKDGKEDLVSEFENDLHD